MARASLQVVRALFVCGVVWVIAAQHAAADQGMLDDVRAALMRQEERFTNFVAAGIVAITRDGMPEVYECKFANNGVFYQSTFTQVEGDVRGGIAGIATVVRDKSAFQVIRQDGRPKYTIEMLGPAALTRLSRRELLRSKPLVLFPTHVVLVPIRDLLDVGSEISLEEVRGQTANEPDSHDRVEVHLTVAAKGIPFNRCRLVFLRNHDFLLSDYELLHLNEQGLTVGHCDYDESGADPVLISARIDDHEIRELAPKWFESRGRIYHSQELTTIDFSLGAAKPADFLLGQFGLPDEIIENSERPLPERPRWPFLVGVGSLIVCAVVLGFRRFHRRERAVVADRDNRPA